MSAESCTARDSAVNLSVKATPVKARKLVEPAEQAPLRTLASLLWPPDPLEDGLNALDDPLNRDEVKPLLHSELLAIGESKAYLRSVPHIDLSASQVHGIAAHARNRPSSQKCSTVRIAHP